MHFDVDKTEDRTNWCQSVTGVVIRDGKVLLARHTYGSGKGKLIIPGGYVQKGEYPWEALKREFWEETRIVIEPRQIIGIRFNQADWYVAFLADYISGEATSDQDENDEVVWIDVKEALCREDVPDLTKQLIRCAKSGGTFTPIPYEGSTRNGKGYLYGAAE